MVANFDEKEQLQINSFDVEGEEFLEPIEVSYCPEKGWPESINLKRKAVDVLEGEDNEDEEETEKIQEEEFKWVKHFTDGKIKDEEAEQAQGEG